jgi:c-di-GMP-binding flagellar brake protein YcgR
LAPAERRDGVLAGVSFDDPGAVHSVVPIELHHVFNRRKAFRVVVGPYEPVEVEFRPSMAKPSRGKMVDLSATGIGVTVEAEAARRIPPRLLIVTIAFTLPYHGKVVATSTIRCRVPTGNGERLGLSFDGRGSRNWGKNERVISQYLMRRQLEIRRAQNPLPP